MVRLVERSLVMLAYQLSIATSPLVPNVMGLCLYQLFGCGIGDWFIVFASCWYHVLFESLPAVSVPGPKTIIYKEIWSMDWCSTHDSAQ